MAVLYNPFSEAAPAEPTDEVLVARARGGDRQALEERVRRHRARIFKSSSGWSTSGRTPRT